MSDKTEDTDVETLHKSRVWNAVLEALCHDKTVRSEDLASIKARWDLVYETMVWMENESWVRYEREDEIWVADKKAYEILDLN